MTENPYYRLINGEPMVSMTGMALLFDLPVEVVTAEHERQCQSGNGGTMRMPTGWTKRGNRVRKECWAALGYEAGMKECIDYLASKA